jgi:hypothetical protein
VTPTPITAATAVLAIAGRADVTLTPAAMGAAIAILAVAAKTATVARPVPVAATARVGVPGMPADDPWIKGRTGGRLVTRGG